MLASNQMDVKRQLRVKYKKWMEESVTKENSLLNGSSIAKQLQSRIKPGANVSCFISKYPEINTKPVLDLLFSIGANVYIPAWHSQEMWMCHAPNAKFIDQLIASTPINRIPMPNDANRVGINSVIFDFIIIPGLVFDLNYHRLGYGYGHYDYFLSRYFAANLDAKTTTKLIGIGYREQMIQNSLPFEEHDIQLDEVLLPCASENEE